MRQKTSKPVSSTRERKVYSTRAASSNTALIGRHWYDEEEPHNAVFEYCRSIKSRQVRRRYQLAIYQQLYRNDLANIFAASGMFSVTGGPQNNNFHRISANVIKSCVDTATSMVARSKPRAFVLPKQGDYRLRRKCLNLTKLLDGLYRLAGVYRNSDDVFRDAGIYGDGALLIEPDQGRVASTVAKVDEVLIDEVTGMYGYHGCQEVFYEHAEPRTKILALYPKFEKEINEARMSWRGEMSFMSQQDLVLVCKAWRKPSITGGKDGRRVVCINNATVDDGPWNKNYLPIVRFSWTPPTYGSFGTGIAQELEAMQWSIANNIRDIDESVRNFAIPRIWIDSLSQIDKNSITNELGMVGKYTGSPPTFSTPPAASQDVYAWLQWKIDWCYKQLGLSQLEAQSEKPEGLDAAVAIRTYQDIGTKRFAVTGQRWENDFYGDIAEILLDTAEDIYKDKGKLTINVPGRGFIERLDFGDVSLERDLYDIQVWPTNILPESPEGQLQAVQEYTSSGFMPKDVALSNMRQPILNAWIDEETAPRDNIERIIWRILDEGKYTAPDGVGNVDLLLQLATNAYLRAPDDGVEPHKEELLLRLVNAAVALKAQQNAANAPPPPPPGAGAPGTPVGQAKAPPPAPLAPMGAGPVTAPPQAA